MTKGTYDTRLTDKQKRYAEARARGLKRNESAIYAGYPESSAPTAAARCEKLEKVQTEINKMRLLIAREEGDIATKDEVLKHFTARMRANDRGSDKAGEVLANFMAKDKGNNGDPKAFFMASLTECDVLADIAKNKPPINVLMGNYQPNTGETAESAER